MMVFLITLVAPVVFARNFDEKPNPIQEKQITLQFKARLLEPGLKNSEQQENREITFGPVNWDTPDKGVVLAHMWNISSLVEFELSQDRHAFQSLRITPVSRNAPTNSWNVWRHRYAYELVPGQGYFWNSLDMRKEPIDSTQALFLDHYLKDVWSYWTIKRLPKYLSQKSGEPISPETYIPDEDPSVAVLSQALKIKYDTQGLLGRVPVSFQIYLANVPVKVFFDIGKATSGTAPVNAPGGIHWSYDRTQWRERHGYRKTLFGGYEWDEQFPTRNDLSDKDGVLLDSLLDHAVEYWVDVAYTQALADVNKKMTRLVAELQYEIDAYNDAHPDN
jgi:hypothetical protein